MKIEDMTLSELQLALYSVRKERDEYKAALEAMATGEIGCLAAEYQYLAQETVKIAVNGESVC